MDDPLAIAGFLVNVW